MGTVVHVLVWGLAFVGGCVVLRETAIAFSGGGSGTSVSDCRQFTVGCEMGPGSLGEPITTGPGFDFEGSL